MNPEPIIRQSPDQPIPYQLTEAGLAAPGPAGALSPQVRELLQAIHEALDLPFVGKPAERAEVLLYRAGDVQVIVRAVLNGHNLANCITDLKKWTAQQPATYADQAREVG